MSRSPRRGGRDSRSRSRGRDGGRDRSRDREPPRRDRDGSPPRGGGGRDRSRSRERGGLSTEVLNLEAGAVAYLLGRNGATKQRLANFSGARLEIDPQGDDGGRVEIIGTDIERTLAKLCIEITLQQRNNGKVVVNLEEIESRGDVSTLDVPGEAVGFVLGSKGATLREFETKYRTFMFFDNDNVRENKKRLYILGTEDNRAKALRECENAVNFKLSGSGSVASWREGQPGGGGRGGYGGGGRPRYDDNYRRSRSRSRDRGYGGRGGYDDRRGGYDDRRGGYDDRRRSPRELSLDPLARDVVILLWILYCSDHRHPVSTPIHITTPPPDRAPLPSFSRQPVAMIDTTIAAAMIGATTTGATTTGATTTGATTGKYRAIPFHASANVAHSK